MIFRILILFFVIPLFVHCGGESPSQPEIKDPPYLTLSSDSILDFCGQIQILSRHTVRLLKKQELELSVLTLDPMDTLKVALTDEVYAISLANTTQQP